MFNLFGSRFADAHEAVKLVRAGKAVLIDVRSPGEFAGRHAAGAINLPVEQLMSGTKPGLDTGAAIYVYCQSGNRASYAQAGLAKMGFTNVQNLGGLRDWQVAGGPVQ